MKKVVIIDIDNCLADDAWRREFLRPQYEQSGLRQSLSPWHVYHDLAPLDTPGFVHEFEVFMRHEQPTDVFFCTMRPEIYRYSTHHWLQRHHPSIRGRVIHRGIEDERPPVRVKFSMLCEICRKYDFALSEIIAAFDDHRAVLDMYREEGLRAVEANIELGIFDWKPGA